jgi:hypothetical protein
VNARPADCVGSVLASTKYQLAFPPLVIHILFPITHDSVVRSHFTIADVAPSFFLFKVEYTTNVPVMDQELPFLTAFVPMPATSDPAIGSVTQYAHMSGSSVIRPRYFFFWASFAPMMTGAC